MTSIPPQDRSRLRGILDRFASVRLALWGDMVVDEFLQGQVNRISREAPVLILDYIGSDWVPGGAANTAANIAAVGATVMPVGLLGEDEAGRNLASMLAGRGIDVSGLRSPAGLVTPTKTRVSGAGLHTTRQQIVRIDRGRAHAPAAAVRAGLAADAARLAAAAHGLIVADYGYDTVDPAEVRRLAPDLIAAQKIVTVDSRRRLLEFNGVTAATPNEPEVEAALGISLASENPEILERAGRDLARRLQCQALLMTRGSRGMAVFPREGESEMIPVHGTDEVADVTGAGDTVIAVFSVALAAGASPTDAARIANIAGGLVVMKRGTATVSAAELRQALDGAP